MKTRVAGCSMILVLGLTMMSSGVTGCALTSKGDALDIKWFSPESAHVRTTSASMKPSNQASGAPVQVELGRVMSGINLREKIAYRDAAHQMGYYEDKRWTERPEVYVRRELARTLFEDHGMTRALVGQAPVLEVEVVAFEEMRPTKSARIELHILLHDDMKALVEKTITVDKPIQKDTTSGLVEAMSLALRTATEEVAKEVESATRANPQTTRP